MSVEAKHAVMEEHVWDADRPHWFHWQELWNRRELFYFFTWRDVKIKYKQTLLGFLWAILQPLMMMIIFSLFFGQALQVPSEDLPYPVFVFSGLIMWNVFSSGLTGSANSMVSNSQIIKKVYFPRLIIPVSSVLVALFDFMMAFLLFAAMLFYYKQHVSISALVYWPLAVMIGVVATLGPGCLLAALNVKYRDFRYVIPFLVQVLFFLSPVIYPVSMLHHDWMRYVIVLSPMYAAIEFFRQPLTGTLLQPAFIATSTTSGLFWMVVGVLYFRKTEDFFADYA